MTFTATTSQLKELSYDYLLFLSSPNYLPFEYSYYVCEYVRHERYLDIYKQYLINHRDILKKIDDEIEEIRKCCMNTSVKIIRIQQLTMCLIRDEHKNLA